MDLAMHVVWAVALIGFVAFTFVIMFGAPFLPTLSDQVVHALDLIDLHEGQTLLELGSGDGRVLAAAAQRGVYAVGYELNPILVVYSWIKLRKYRSHTRVVWGNFWRTKLPDTDGIFVFLLQPYMQKLDTKIMQECRKPVKLVSFAFNIEGRKPSKEHRGLYLYEYR